MRIPEELPEGLKKIMQGERMFKKNADAAKNDLEKELLMPLFSSATNGELSYSSAMNIIVAYCGVMDAFAEQTEMLPADDVAKVMELVQRHAQISLEALGKMKEDMEQLKKDL